MDTMRWVPALALVAALTTSGTTVAHEYSKTCNMVVGVYADQADTGVFSLVESIAPGSTGAIGDGLFYCHVPGAQGGDEFTVTSDAPVEPFVIGLADECPGPDWSPQGLVTGEDSPEDVWLVCNNGPDFDIKFTCGEYYNGPGDEGGTVPCSGDAVITTFFGTPGTSVTYSER